MNKQNLEQRLDRMEETLGRILALLTPEQTAKVLQKPPVNLDANKHTPPTNPLPPPEHVLTVPMNMPTEQIGDYLEERLTNQFGNLFAHIRRGHE